MTTNGIVVGFERQPHEAPQEPELTSEQKVAEARAAIARGEMDGPGLIDDALDHALTGLALESEAAEFIPDPNAVDEALANVDRIQRHGPSARRVA